jgi:chromosome partitioning protein
MYIIAIANEKGGVAKTTTSVSLGATLAEMNKKVLIIDLDAQANLSIAVGIENEKASLTISKGLLEAVPLASMVIPTSYNNLFLVPSNHEMGLAERFLSLQPNYEFTLRTLVEGLKSEYDFVLLDCPPFLGVVTLNALVASNMLLIPTQAEYFSIYALRNLMNWVKRIRAQFNPELVYRLLLTMYDRRNRIHRILAQQLQDNFTTGMLKTVIETDTKLRESPLAGIPIILHAPKSRAAQQYRALAQEIVEYVKETVVQPAG